MKIFLKKESFIFYREISCKNFPKSHFREYFSKTLSKRVFFKILENFSNFSKIYTHKKIVVHFFTPMLFLPKSPPFNIYLKLKKLKGPKTASLFSLFSLHFTSQHGGRRSIAGMAQATPPHPSDHRDGRSSWGGVA